MKTPFFVLVGVMSVCFSGLAQAEESCPYLATDTRVLGLSESVKGLLSGLQEAKAQCGESFVQAVKTVQPLPELLGALDDPTLEQRVARDGIESQIAISAANGSSSEELDALMTQKLELDRQIEATEKLAGRTQKQENQKKAIAMMSNLLGSVNLAAQDQKCREYLSNHAFSQLSQVGMGFLSAASPLLFSAGSSTGVGIGIVSGMLSDVISMINQIPPRAMREFENTKRTLELACMYHAVISLTCSTKESALTPETMERSRARLKELAACIPSAATYNQYINANRLKDDLQKILVSLGTADVAKLGNVGFGAGAGSDLTKEIAQLNSGASAGVETKKEKYEVLQKKAEFLERVLVKNPDEFATARSDVKNDITSLLDTVVLEAHALFSQEGAPLEFYNEKNSKKSFVQIFRENNDRIKKIFQKMIDEDSGGGDGALAKNEDPLKIHTQVDLAKALKQMDYIEGFFKNVKGMKAEDFEAGSVDWSNLNSGMETFETLLSKLRAWSQLDRKKFATEEEFKVAIKKQTMEVADFLKAKTKNQTNFEIETAVNEVVSAPFLKLYSMLTKPKLQEQAKDDPFADPFQNTKSVSNFERFSLLRGVATKLQDSFSEVNDRFLLSKTRRMYETSELRSNFLDGLADLIKQTKTDTDAKVADTMVRELCGLAISLPPKDVTFGKDSWHALPACEKRMPERMKDYYSPSRENRDECAYMKYFQDKVREDSGRFGRTVTLPVSGVK